jgi:hypothetical protein
VRPRRRRKRGLATRALGSSKCEAHGAD